MSRRKSLVIADLGSYNTNNTMKTTQRRYQENLRLRKEDKELLTSLAEREKITKSEYIRNLIRNQQRVFTLSAEEFSELRKEFSKLSLIGSNLNQISFHMNKDAKQGKLHHDYYLSEIKETFQELKKELSVVQKQIIKMAEFRG